MSTLPNKDNQRYGMPGYRGQYLPLPPMPTYPYSQQQQPMPQLPAQQGQVPVAPQPQQPRTLMDKLKDPRLGALLATMGATMSQPRQVGQTGWGQAGSAMASGYNTLAAMRAMQDAQKRQQWEDQLRLRGEQRAQESHESGLETAGAQRAAVKAGTENTQVKTKLLPAQQALEERKVAEEKVFRDATISGNKEAAARAWEALQETKRQFNESMTQRKAEFGAESGQKDKELNLKAQQVRTDMAQAQAQINKLNQEVKTMGDLSNPKSPTAMSTAYSGLNSRIQALVTNIGYMDEPEKSQAQAQLKTLEAAARNIGQKLGYEEAPKGGGKGAQFKPETRSFQGATYVRDINSGEWKRQ